MPRIGVSITKSVAFRNSTQEFSNVYYFEALVTPSEAQALTTIDNLTALEKTFHATTVTFVRGRCWSTGGTQQANTMLGQKALSGTGARTTNTSFDKERAFLFRIRAGVDSRGNPVYLRKYYHACGEFVLSAGVGAAILQNASGFTSGERSAQVAAMSAIGDGNGSPNTLKICSKQGRVPDVGATWSAHEFLEHHQLGDQWRAS